VQLKREKTMQKLAKIQATLKAPKGQTNSFGNYKYRSCEDILEAVKPLLGDSILTISDEMIMIGDRFYVKATATLTVVANVITGYTITTQGNGYLAMPNVTVNRNDGNTGSAVSITGNVGYGYINKITVLNPGYGGYYFIPNALRVFLWVIEMKFQRIHACVGSNYYMITD
jgi:hypothetical protein